ncbi:unnamed protein product [Camellia sinensis]
MELTLISEDATWWLFTLPAILKLQAFFNTPLVLSIFTIIAILGTLGLLTWAFSTSGPAWKYGRNQMGRVPIPGFRGLPIFGSLFSLSHGLAHRTLASMASSQAATQLMAFSLGSTPAVIASDPVTAREILTSPHFANRPIKHSAKQLMFSRAIGFAPNGTYWRLLRRIASSHLFAPKRILAHEAGRRLDCAAMLSSISKEQTLHGFVVLRKHLQAASLNNIMEIVFGKRYDTVHDSDEEAREVQEIVREGFELLGAFNWCDHLPWLKYFYDPFCIDERCVALAPRVKRLVNRIIDEHRRGRVSGSVKLSDDSDFVDVLLSLEGEEKLEEDDMVAVLWVFTCHSPATHHPPPPPPPSPSPATHLSPPPTTHCHYHYYPLVTTYHPPPSPTYAPPPATYSPPPPAIHHPPPPPLTRYQPPPATVTHPPTITTHPPPPAICHPPATTTHHLPPPPTRYHSLPVTVTHPPTTTTHHLPATTTHHPPPTCHHHHYPPPPPPPTRYHPPSATEMIFRGTDTTALLTEWVMAQLVLNPVIQAKLQHELETLIGTKTVTDNDISKLPYLQAVVKETLRVHPPGPLLSWARLSTSDVHLSNGMVIPADTTAMVNMWAITHDPNVWDDPTVFKPERFLPSEVGGVDVTSGFDVRGNDLRLAPFGAGRRVCPGKNLGLVTVSLWVAKLVHHFKWVEDISAHPIDLSEVLKLSCEMKNPLSVVAVPRTSVSTF